MRMRTDIVARDRRHQQHPYILGRRIRSEAPPVLTELVLRHHEVAGRRRVGPDPAQGDERALRHSVPRFGSSSMWSVPLGFKLSTAFSASRIARSVASSTPNPARR